MKHTRLWSRLSVAEHYILDCGSSVERRNLHVHTTVMNCSCETYTVANCALRNVHSTNYNAHWTVTEKRTLDYSELSVTMINYSELSLDYGELYTRLW